MSAPLVRSPDADAETAEEKMNQEIIVSDSEAEQARATPATPMSMIEEAVAKGANVDIIDRLMTLQERWDANHARKAFDAARAAAKAEISRRKIFKNRTGHNNTRYADFSAYAEAIDPVLSEYGLGYGFETEQTDRIKVTCVLSHVDGHSVRNSLSGPPDQTGNKNAIQAIGSTLTYLQRYTLTAALGLAASSDDDGKAAGAGEAISEEQVKHLRTVVAEVGADEAAFAKYLGVDDLATLPAKHYDRAIAALGKKQAKKS